MDCIRPGGEDDIAVESNQFVSKFTDPVEHFPGEACLDDHILTVYVTSVPEPVEQRDHKLALDIQKEAKPRNRARPLLLRASRDRPPSRRAASSA